MIVPVDLWTCRILRCCGFGSVDVPRADGASVVPLLTVTRQQHRPFIGKKLHEPHHNEV